MLVALGSFIVGVGMLLTIGIGLYGTYASVKLVLDHKISQGIALEFLGIPLLAGFVNIAVSGAGMLIVRGGQRMRDYDPDRLDAITRRAIQADPEVRDLWEDEY